MTDAELQEIRDRHAATTPGEWKVGIPDDALCHCFHLSRTLSGKRVCCNVFANECEDVTAPCAGLDPVDAAFIAHAHQDVPALLAEIERLKADLADNHCNSCDGSAPECRVSLANWRKARESR